jgi:phosphoglycolate phosphatase-like HAD superfamily hydrolase
MAIILPILSTFNASGVKAAQGQLAGLGASLKRLAAPAAIAAAGFNALQGAIRFAGDAVSEARDLERNMAALGTVFTDLTPRMTNFVKNANNIGLSQVEAARTTTFLGSVLKQAGFGMDEVADNTEKLTVLAQDLATTFGYDTSEALTAMTALFRGEYDPIEKFGVALKQNEINSLVAARGLGNLTGQAMLNAQQMIRMEQLFLRSTDAQGAFARGAGTLFVEQKKLTASFSDMQAIVGKELTPALARMMQQLTPIIEDLTPVLTETFDLLGKSIYDLTPIIEPLGGIVVNLFDSVNLLVRGFENLNSAVAPELIEAFDLFEDISASLTRGLDELAGILGNLKTGFEELPAGPITQFFAGLYVSVSKLTPILNPLANTLIRLRALFPEEAPNFDLIQDRGGRERALMRARAAALKRLEGTDPPDPQEPKARDYVKDFYAELKDEVEKQASRLKLANLGASKAFIESIVGAGEDWKKVFASVAARGKEGVARLQREFNKTSAGLKEIAEANDAAIKAAQDAYDEAFKAYEKQLEVYNKQIEAIKELKTALKDLTTAVAPLAVVTREIGQFEQSTVDSFDNIVKAITDGVADGTLLKDAAQGLIDYARKEQAVIADLMRQRDELVNRRSLAQALMADVKSTIVGMGNITEILAKNATDVTETIIKMVGNVQVATSKVIKGATGGASELIASFTETLNKTKAFAQQLKDLRALGLDKNLYQQIVSAGIDAGGATAKAILEGGTGTVSELNSLFKELDTVGSEIAEQSAQVMYGAGIDLVDGLIAGMISKEQELVNYATTLANAFATAFSDRVNLALPMPSAPIAPTLGSLTQTMAVNSALLDTFAVARDFAGSAENYYSGSESIRFANIAQRQGVPINITVNAGLGTDGKIVGQTIQSYINKYNKANSSF